ncbi:MAG: hypothetical protein KAU49_02865, partial [Candidatus Krumholzibacteria bacterium]|nr:hypothetical protein [Candidatus Krumholzibacteria bacterium]
EERIPPPVIEIPWPDMTDRDDVIRTVVLGYTYPKDAESSAQYEALLHSLYFFGLAPGDFEPGDPNILTKAQDVEVTNWLFTAQVLELKITPEKAAWYAYTNDLDGKPCENCYSTQRDYFIQVQFDDESTIYQSPPGNASISIIVAPDENDSSKWVLRAMLDLGIGGS